MKAVYIHIPFCSNICSYCDFSKIIYNKELVDKYLIALEQEIKNNYQQELIKTIYLGGGTPSSLSLEQLAKLFNIIKIFNFADDVEFTIECNPENTDIDKLKLFKEHKVNRLSIGIQTFNEEFLQLLNRHHSNKQVITLIKNAKKIGITNINVDLIYGLPNQTLAQLKEDIDNILSLDITHISTYSLILEEHTKLYIDKVNNIDPDLEYTMYQYICDTLKANHFIHYEISNFAKPNYQSRHNLNYWHNEPYYGFGLGAHGYIENIRYENTRSINNYGSGHYRYKEKVVNKNEQMEYEMILGLRKISGINKQYFKDKYKIDIYQAFPLNKLINNKDLIDDGTNIYIPIDKIYISNEILINFIL